MRGVSSGDVLAGRFELLERIGAGGLAEVFRARDRVSASEVALKILHPHVAEDGGLVERFRRELAVTRSLDHPGIVRVFDLHEHEGRPFFSMELLSGQPLSERLRAGPLPPDEARRVAREICQALATAHRAGVIHRDLKPQNVILTRTGAVKLLDFGLARVAGHTRLTSQSAVMGTPGYVAPELLSGQRADARADIYSLGATWFEMVTGQRPFASSDPYQTPRPSRDPAPSVRALNPDVSEADEAVLQRMLEPDPEQRFLDVGQLLRALSGEEVPPPPHTPPPLTAGELDVLVHSVIRPLDLFQGKQPIRRVLERLGADAPVSWKLKLAGAGQAVLVSGASRRTAEVAAAVCAEHGLPATIRSVRDRPRSEEPLARWGGALLAALGVALAAAAAALLELDALRTAGWAAAAGLTGWVLSWGLRPPASMAPLIGLPAQDSSLARLADGVQRRADRLRQDRAALPEDQQRLVDDLTRAAGEAAGLARQLSSAPDTPAGAELRALDLVTNRLLEIATALDDALAAAFGSGSESRTLLRLRDDVAAARQALPDLKALGTPPGGTPLPLAPARGDKPQDRPD